MHILVVHKQFLFPSWAGDGSVPFLLSEMFIMGWILTGWRYTTSGLCQPHSPAMRLGIYDFPGGPVLSHWYFCCLSDQRVLPFLYTSEKYWSNKAGNCIFLKLVTPLNCFVIIHDKIWKIYFRVKRKQKL